MALFAVSYDLHNQRTYPPVWQKLEGWNAVRLLESLWLVTLNATAAQVRDALTTATDKDDSIAVIELEAESDWACLRARDTGVAWLKKHMP